MLDLDTFRRLFSSYTSDWDWQVEGFIDKKQFVYPIDLDTKVISTIFERLSSPVINTIADALDYSVEIANQTTYPDFTLTHSDPSAHRIAIDIKTTYTSPRMLFTLGGYNSFLRNNTKNILHPYSTYNEHWIIGFVYHQNAPFPVYSLANMPKPGQIDCPYNVSAVFVRHKHSISGLRAGSGNTKNIGSVIVNNPADFASVNGPFTNFRRAKDACDHYWRNYEVYIKDISRLEHLLIHPDFKQFEPENEKN